jgi:hypothetical protein
MAEAATNIIKGVAKTSSRICGATNVRQSRRDGEGLFVVAMVVFRVKQAVGVNDEIPHMGIVY